MSKLWAVDKLLGLWISPAQEAFAGTLDDEVLDVDVLDDEEFELLLDDFESDEDDADEAGVGCVEPPSDAVAPALALPSDLLSVR
jgi:hypothetical protein